jgi:hypothetical protein
MKKYKLLIWTKAKKKVLMTFYIKPVSNGDLNFSTKLMPTKTDNLTLLNGKLFMD